MLVALFLGTAAHRVCLLIVVCIFSGKKSTTALMLGVDRSIVSDLKEYPTIVYLI
jgi:hypothetical protein